MLILAKAIKIVDHTARIISPHCNRFDVVGSVRRGNFEVHDIEYCCEPKKVPISAVNLFETTIKGYKVSPEFEKAVIGLGKIVKGSVHGRMMQVQVNNPHGGVKTLIIDLFMPQVHDYYRMVAIRTGSKEYSQRTIANGWLKKGWCGTKDGLRLQAECQVEQTSEGKPVWFCKAEHPTLPPSWNSEKEFFEWMGVPFIHPRLRSV